MIETYILNMRRYSVPHIKPYGVDSSLVTCPGISLVESSDLEALLFIRPAHLSLVTYMLAVLCRELGMLTLLNVPFEGRYTKNCVALVRN